MKVNDIRNYFIEELKNENFTVDRTGQKTIELIGASFQADEESIFGEPNKEYIQAELDWYLSQSMNVNDIYPDKDAPAAWKYSANQYGEINSNYGKLIFSDMYQNQYNNAVTELVTNMDSRRATMVYTRPSIWSEYQDNGKNDFICTNAVTYYLRDGRINCVVQMRSNDVVYGYKNDYAWQKFVLEQFVQDYNTAYMESTWDAEYRKTMEVGGITWQVQNLHVYERHFHLVK